MATREGALEEIERLAKASIFKGLARAQLVELGSIAKRRFCAAGETVLREGEMGTSMLILVSGDVELSKTLALCTPYGGSEEREKQLVRFDGSSLPCLGEMGMLCEQARSATVTALTACEFLEIERADFEALCEADPVLGYRVVSNIAQTLAQRLEKTNRDVVKLTTALCLALGAANRSSRR